MSGLPSQRVDLPLGMLDTKRDPKTAPPGIVTEAQNAIRVKAGEYRKRGGRVAMATACVPSGSLPAIWQLAFWKGNAVALSQFGSPALFRYAQATGKWLTPSAGGDAPGAVRTMQRGALVSSRVSIDTAEAGDQPSDIMPDVAIIPGTNYVVVVFAVDGTLSRFVEMIVDLGTGSAIWRREISGDHAHVEAVTASSKVVVVYTDGTHVRARFWNAAAALSGSPGAANVGVAQPGGGPPFQRLDTAPFGQYVAVAVTRDTASTTRVMLIDPVVENFPASSDLAIQSDRTLGFLRDDGGSGKLLLGAGGSTAGVVVHVLTADAIGGAVTIDVSHTLSTDVGDDSTTASNNAGDRTARNITGFTTDSDTTGHFVALWDVPDGLDAPHTVTWNDKTRIGVRAADGTISRADFIRSMGLRSKAFAIGGDHFVILAYTSKVQPAYFVVRVPPDWQTMAEPKPRGAVCKLEMWRGNGAAEQPAGLGNVVRLPNTVSVAGALGLVTAVPRQVSTRTKAGARIVTNGIDLVTMVTDPTATGRPLECADSLMVPAGQMLSFDGASFAELGFPLFPEKPIVAADATPGSMAHHGRYEYAVVYRHTDAQGRVHRSAPSIGASLALADDQSAAKIQIPYLRSWGRDSGRTAATWSADVTVELYRTIDGGTTLYLLHEFENLFPGNPGGSEADAIVWVDTTGDVASGTITCHAKSTFSDGDTFVLDDGFNAPLTFEFDKNGDGITTGHVSVNISTDTTAIDVATRLTKAINDVGSRLAITATDNGDGTVTLTNDFSDGSGPIDIYGKVKITIAMGVTGISATAESDGTGLDRSTILYTAGGVLPNHAPPQAVTAVVHRGRLWVVDADERSKLWYTKRLVDGKGPEFTDSLALEVADEFGDVVALASMDDKLVIVKQRAIYIVVGDGPDDTGNGSYPEPHRVGTGSGIGAAVARAVLGTPDGVWFQSAVGGDLYLLDRGLNIQLVGGPVSGFGGKQVFDAIHVGSLNQVRFYDTLGGCLIYDTYWKEWFHWTGQGTTSVVEYQGAIVQVSPFIGNQPTLDADGTYTDEGAAFPLRIAFARLSLAGIAGFQRLRSAHLVGQYQAPHHVLVDVYYDLSDTVAETLERKGDAGAPWRYEMRPARQKCSEFTLAIYDGAPATGTIAFVPRANLVDPDRFTIWDGDHQFVEFRFDLVGAVGSAPYIVHVPPGVDTAAQVAAAAKVAIDACGLNYIVTDNGDGTLTLEGTRAKTFTTPGITEAVDDAGFTVSFAANTIGTKTESFRLSQVALEVAIKGPMGKMPAASRLVSDG